MEMAIENMKPKIFWKDKPIFLKQIKKWNSEKLKRAKEVVIETEIKMKTKLNNYNGILIKYLLIRLYQIADSTS
jgi:DNA polymerase III delta subunit